MRIKISIILLFTCLKIFAQFDYDLYLNLTTKESLRMNSPLVNITEYQLDNGIPRKMSYQQFRIDGFPATIIQYDQQEQIVIKKDFVYDSLKYIKSIETYNKGKHESSSEFTVNQLGQIIAYTDYVYSSYDGDKLIVWKTILDYNKNGTLSKTLKLQGENHDTCEINFYDNFGILTKTILNRPGLRTKKIEYFYNNDSTEMLEKHYEDENNVYTTIIHKYKNKKEIERIDLTTSPKPFYWKYDDIGNVLETNEGFYYILHNIYNPMGYLTKRIFEIIFSDSDEKDLPKKLEYMYEYQFRK